MNVFDLFAKISLDTSEYEEGLENSEKGANTFGSKIKSGLATAGKVAVGAVAAVGTAAVAAGTALVKSAGSVAQYGDNVDKMSQKMGLSAQAYQEWDAILQHSGASIETMKSGMKTLATAAETGSDAFEKLGMSQEEIANMSQEELFSATITALQNVTDETERTYLASKLLGRGGTELGALLNTSAEDTEKMRQRVHELGGVMSDEAVKASAAYQDSLQDMKTALAGVKRGLISDFLPSITKVMDGLTKIFAGESGGVEMMTEGISSILKNLQEAAPRFMEVGKSIVESLYKALLDNLPQIIQGGTELIVNLVIGIVESIPQLVEAGVQIVTTIAQTLWENFPRLVEAGKNAVTSLTQGMTPEELIAKAGELLDDFLNKALEYLPKLLESGVKFVTNMAQGVSNNMPSIIQAITKVLSQLITTIMNKLPDFLQKGVELIGQMISGIAQNLPNIISSMAGLLVDLIAKIAENLPEFLQKGIELIGQMIAGIVSAVPDILSSIGDMLSDMWDKVTSIDWWSLGGNIIDGIKNGVISAGKNLVSAAVQAVKDAFNAMKSFLGIQSPSKLARDVLGKNWSIGIGEGFEKYMPVRDMVGSVEDAFGAVQEAIPEVMYGDVTASATGAGNGADRLGEIIDLLKNVGVYLDGRTLVGALTTDIDRALGREAVLVGRGVA